MLTRASAIVCRQTLFKANIISQEMATYRYIHSVRQVRKIPRSSLLDLRRNCRIIGIPPVRYASTNETAESTSVETAASETTIPESAVPEPSPYDEIPDPPAPIEEIIENIVKFHPNGEATFASIGLGGWSPLGLVQQFFEFVHITGNVPWWATIVIGTICVRTIMLPFVIIAQKNTIKFTNHMPKITELQMKMTDARQSGDYIESARAATELMQYMKKNDISALRNLITPLMQAPVFISFFLGLRQMANTPVESLKEGGYFWLTDLTMPDPYYIMPVITSVTMYITLELGADGTNLKAMGLMRYAVRAMPFAILPFIITFPGAIVTYWASTNFVSLAQTGMLKIPYIRKKLNMPTINRAIPQIKKRKGFVEEFKESWTNMKITRELESRERIDAIQFDRAGKGPLVKTFKFDPTKQKETTIYARKR